MADPRWTARRQTNSTENYHIAPVNNNNPADINYNSGIILEPGGEAILPGKGNMRIADEINYLKSSVVNGKYAIASAISDKGIPALGGEEFGTLATKISQINTGGRKQLSNGWVGMPITNDPWIISLPFTPVMVHVQMYVVSGYLRSDNNSVDYMETYSLHTVTKFSASATGTSRQSWNGFEGSHNYVSFNNTIFPSYYNRNVAVDFNATEQTTGSKLIPNGFSFQGHHFQGDFPGNYAVINYAAYE